MIKSIFSLLLFLFVLNFQPAFAREFMIPSEGNALIGNRSPLYISATEGTTPTLLAQEYNLGLNAIIAANPGATDYNMSGNTVRIPRAFLLPPLPRQGIVINLPEMRMYYYPENSADVMTFPIGIGKVGKTIPIENTRIARKVVNPVWTPTPDIRQYNREQGIELPHQMPAGPDNPLGSYAIYLRIPTYLIHSTIFPESIGRRASFGCIRMNESDIKEFFPLVRPGTAVSIINMPNKLGWNGKQLYLEAHPLLEEHSQPYQATLDNLVNTIEKMLPSTSVTLVNWQLVSHILRKPDGIPHEIGVRIS
ncbi:MAG: ynhG [Gammaproteobacteria bacterium]|jgi:L,D-transpeptidase ErfK/SrfK|nr:ynhG [Gammaproteobacteria bacterium]